MSPPGVPFGCVRCPHHRFARQPFWNSRCRHATAVAPRRRQRARFWSRRHCGHRLFVLPPRAPRFIGYLAARLILTSSCRATSMSLLSSGPLRTSRGSHQNLDPCTVVQLPLSRHMPLLPLLWNVLLLRSPLLCPRLGPSALLVSVPPRSASGFHGRAADSPPAGTLRRSPTRCRLRLDLAPPSLPPRYTL